MKENPSFIQYDQNKPGLILDDFKHPEYPVQFYNIHGLKGWPDYVLARKDQKHANFNRVTLNPSFSYYFYVYQGQIAIYGGLDVIVKKEGYFSTTGERIRDIYVGENTKAILIVADHTTKAYAKNKFRAVDTFGFLEDEGRLKYIDGCTDSLLIPPVKLGDPCLNHLHFPPNIEQTMHTHPSHRIGMVARGNGRCVTPFGDLPLTEGMIFVIKEHQDGATAKAADGKSYPTGSHCFFTDQENMDVIAFHPDSDFGATDVDHPMINRTIVDGVSASQLKDIQTK
jgi:hypothetical protein